MPSSGLPPVPYPSGEGSGTEGPDFKKKKKTGSVLTKSKWKARQMSILWKPLLTVRTAPWNIYLKVTQITETLIPVPLHASYVTVLN